MSASTPPEAFCDANVLYPSLLRDLLIRLDIEGLCRLSWSDEVNEEWINALVRDRHLNRAPLNRTLQLMNEAVPHARVTGFHHLVPGLTLPDPDDRHVLAAALHSGAPHLITFNLSDFPAPTLSGTALHVVHPDVWLAPVLAHEPTGTCRVVRKLIAPYRRPSRSIADVAETLASLRLPDSAGVLRTMLARGIC